MSDAMTREEAADYIPQWGSYMRDGDPGAIAYGPIPPETREARDSLVAYLTECKTFADHNGAPPSDDDTDDRVELARAIAYLESLFTGAPRYIIEICPHEPRASICGMNGESVALDPDIADCRASGDCEPACEYVRDSLGVRFTRIVCEGGTWINRDATDDELSDTCRAIYFDSETDFSDRDTCETYLIWQAACDAESESGD